MTEVSGTRVETFVVTLNPIDRPALTWTAGEPFTLEAPVGPVGPTTKQVGTAKPQAAELQQEGGAAKLLAPQRPRSCICKCGVHSRLTMVSTVEYEGGPFP